MSGTIKFRGPLRYTYTVRGRSSWTFVVLTFYYYQEILGIRYMGEGEEKDNVPFVRYVRNKHLKEATRYDDSIKRSWEIKLL